MKIALLTNIISPYRVPIYKSISNEYELAIFTSGNEDNRDPSFIEYQTLNCQIKESWGFTFKKKIKNDDKIYDHKYLHIKPGVLIDLIRFKPKLIISVELGARTIFAILYGVIFRVPVWVWWGGTNHTEKNIGYLKTHIRRLLPKFIDRWLSYGLTSTKYLEYLGVNFQDIIQLQNAVDDNLFRNDISPKLSFPTKPVLLIVGQIIKRKGIYEFIDIVKRLKGEGYQFSVVFIGDGPEKVALQKLILQYHLNDIYLYSSFKPDEMPSIYKSGDILVFPTLEDVWGLVANEAILSGIPVLSSIYAGCTYEIIPKNYQFDPLNQDEFYQKLKLYLENKLGSFYFKKLSSMQEINNLLYNEIEKELKE